MTRRIYAQSDALGNRVGLHYSRFRPKRKTPSLANQILSRLKNLKIRVFDRESAKTGYVADEGNGTNTFDPASGKYTAAATQTGAGLQKWVFDTGLGAWKLAYVLQAGLNLGVPYTVANYPTGQNPKTGLPWAPAADGLRNIVGRVNRDGTATIWAHT